jgi:hypothetical protein
MSMKLRNVALAFAFVLAALCVKSDEAYAGCGSRWSGYSSGCYCPNAPGYGYASNYGYVSAFYQPYRSQYYGSYAYPGRRHIRGYNRRHIRGYNRGYNRRVYRRQHRRHYRRR